MSSACYSLPTSKYSKYRNNQTQSQKSQTTKSNQQSNEQNISHHTTNPSSNTQQYQISLTDPKQNLTTYCHIRTCSWGWWSVISIVSPNRNSSTSFNIWPFHPQQIMETPDTFHQDKMENKPDNLCDNCTERYFKAIKCEMENDLKIVRLPEHFSQSKFTKSSRGSNACTLIVLLLSRGIEILQRQNIGWWIHKDFNMDSAILYALAESILQGK